MFIFFVHKARIVANSAGVQKDYSHHFHKFLQITAIKNFNGLDLFKVTNLQNELTEHIEDTKTRFGNLDKEIHIFRNNYVTEVQECRRSSDGLDQRLSKLEGVCVRLDSFSDSLERIKEGLNRHVSGLWSCINELNTTVTSHGALIDNIQTVQLENIHSRIHKLNSSVLDLGRQFHIFRNRDFTGESKKAGAMGFNFESKENTYLMEGMRLK